MEHDSRLEEAHEHSSHHRVEVLSSARCGCFYCLRILDPIDIREWVDDDTTAVCPYCSVDSVVGSNSGLPITMEFLTEMKTYWFDSRG